jgi:transposase
MSNNDVNPMDEEQYAVMIGVDWASEKHDVCLHEPDSGKRSHRVIVHTPEALAEWIAELRATSQGRPVAICLEQTRGALIHALLGHEFIHLYPINPATLAKYREAFSPSRAKDDPTDAALLLELLLKHRDKLKAWKPDDADTRTLGILTEDRRRCVDWRTKLVLRLQAVLKGYFPQALALVADNLTSNMACDFIQKWPTLDALKRAKPQAVRAFYYGHNYRRGDLIEENLEKIRTAVALTEDKAIVTTSTIAVQTLAKQIRVNNAAVAEYDEQIKALYRQHPDAFIFESLPGSGKVMGPRLLCAYGTDRGRYADASDIQAYSGIAPVVERSGKHEWVHWRWGCPTFLRQSFHEYANCSRNFSAWAKAYYDLQRERGKKHHAAVRALAFKWQRVIFRCWQDRSPYDEERYIQALKISSSPLWPRIHALQNP